MDKRIFQFVRLFDGAFYLVEVLAPGEIITSPYGEDMIYCRFRNGVTAYIRIDAFVS